MATNAKWTVIFDDKLVVKNYAEGANGGVGYKINDDAFWATTAFQNIWAIQSGTSNTSDEVEHRDSTPHNSLADEGISISQFISRWDAAHLLKLQEDWDNNDGSTYDTETPPNVINAESESEKIARVGPRPTSYSS